MFHVKHFAFYESNSRPSLPVVMSPSVVILNEVKNLRINSAKNLYSWLRVDSAKNLGLNEITT